ncbi:MAG: VCBS repeat-containing protein [Acidobacteria bacterium]|nr:VCBS repeat-containing protein [Acidobacteriota bacterium]
MGVGTEVAALEVVGLSPHAQSGLGRATRRQTETGPKGADFDLSLSTSMASMLSRQFVAAIGAAVIGCSAAEAQTPSRITFSRVVTEPGLGNLEFVHAAADFNGDGRDDIRAGGADGGGAMPEDRFTKTMLEVLVSVGDGSFRHAPELVEGTINVRNPVVVADDFNGDMRPDLAVFDGGVYVTAHSLGYGNPPQLFLSDQDGRLRPSDALANAVRQEHELRPNPDYSGPQDLHLKSAASGDIDGDGDIDLWVDSIGGANVSSHFMVNNGDGTFTLDEARAPPELRYNWPEAWYHLAGHLVDLDNDGDLDLALGQNRGTYPETINQFSIVLINDGTGHYPARTELPRPAFADGYTSVTGQTHFDVNGDGVQDLILAHPRNDDGPPSVLPWTGRYIQVLVNEGVPSPVFRRRRAISFVDETSTWMGSQRSTTPERNAVGDPLQKGAEPRMHDVDRDGCADLVMVRGPYPLGDEAPLIYRNNGSGQFQAVSPEAPLAGTSRHIVPADLNGDRVIDFVYPQHHNGPDNRYRTADDFVTFVAFLNTTPPGPVRCE